MRSRRYDARCDNASAARPDARPQIREECHDPAASQRPHELSASRSRARRACAASADDAGGARITRTVGRRVPEQTCIHTMPTPSACTTPWSAGIWRARENRRSAWGASQGRVAREGGALRGNAAAGRQPGDAGNRHRVCRHVSSDDARHVWRMSPHGRGHARRGCAAGTERRADGGAHARPRTAVEQLMQGLVVPSSTSWNAARRPFEPRPSAAAAPKRPSDASSNTCTSSPSAPPPRRAHLTAPPSTAR